MFIFFLFINKKSLLFTFIQLTLLKFKNFMISKVKIAIIGCGNLGTSIANGLLSLEGFSPAQLTLTKRHTESLVNF
ncbi:MAG: NAD(P)-binding domain-containing protein, partial [Leptospira sp.]|nr:NAD(P)-binding domain-containing protein [Leptospira sp.]